MKKTAKRAVPVLCFLLLTAGCVEPPLRGHVYHDANQSARSDHAQRMELVDRGLPGIPVRLLGAAGEREAVTDAAGAYAFSEQEPGTYLIDVQMDPVYACTSRNQPKQVPGAVRAGHLRMVTIGDSVGAMGSEVLYPERLAARFRDLVPTSVENLAVSGSATWDWLPGSARGYFENRLVPALQGAHLLTITLAGNDLSPYLGDPPYEAIDPWELLQKFLDYPEYLLEMVPRIEAIVRAVGQERPDLDIVWAVYPNVANSTLMVELLGDLQPLASLAAGIGLAMLREVLADAGDLVLADLYGALGATWMDPYLLDEVHPNDAGHQFYADTIFRALGGVVLEPGVPQDRKFGFYAPDLLP